MSVLHMAIVTAIQIAFKRIFTIVLFFLFYFVPVVVADEQNSMELDSIYLRSISEITAPTYALKINELAAANLSLITDEAGEYDDWIELYNFGDDTINLNGLYISDDSDNLQKFIITVDTLLAPQQFALIWADNEPLQGALHTNFKLDGLGETIYISNTEGSILDSVAYPEIHTNITYGRLPDNFLNWSFFTLATPGAENASSGYEGLTEAPECNYTSGFYQDTLLVKLSHPDRSVIITYTLNGKVPTTASAHYSEPIELTETTILRYRAFKTDKLPSTTQTSTFLFNDQTTLDVVSVVGNPNDLTSSGGLFVTKQRGVEKGVHIEYFGADKKLKFNIDGGVQLHSPKSNSQLSFRLYARSDYGDETMNHPVFKDKNIDSFKRLVLRNSGNDGTVLNRNSLIHFRDGLHQTLLNEMGHPELTSAYRPVSVFINGRYWGVYNARERIDKYFIESNFGYTGDMDLLERAFHFSGNKNAIEGSYKLYNQLDNFVKSNDLTVDTSFNYIASYIDLKSYTDYWIHEIYIGNFDWMNNNIKIYRPNKDGAKFKWLLWDTDHGGGMPYGNYGEPSWNTLTWSVSVDEVRTEKGRDNAFMRKLIENEGFRTEFINRYADLLNTLYTYDHVASTIDSISTLIENDMSLHRERWNLSESRWKSALKYVKDYYNKRNAFVRKDIISLFKLQSQYSVKLQTSDSLYGTVNINTLEPEFEYNSWQGIYFKNVPITITAKPNAGFQFSHWNNNPNDTIAVKSVALVKDTIFKAYFTPLYLDTTATVVINEIKFGDDEGGWVELYNNSIKDIDIEDWTLKTPKVSFKLNDTVLHSGAYLVVRGDDTEEDNGIFEDDELSVELRDSKNNLIDFVDFSNGQIWSQLPYKYNFSMELISPDLDNSLARSWRSSIYLGGTPGSANSPLLRYLTHVRINEVLASNSQTVYDNVFEYDDYIELYNSGVSTTDLRGLLITNDEDNPVKYQIPNAQDSIKLEADDFALIWADKSNDQGPLHVNFKLSLGGESLYLYENNGYKLILIDALSYNEQYTDISYGANYDGNKGQWSYQVPTPLMSNNPLAINIHETESSDLVIYPQPASTHLIVELPKVYAGILCYVEIFNLMGQRTVAKTTINREIEINTTELSSGIYVLRISNSKGQFISKTLIIE